MTRDERPRPATPRRPRVIYWNNQPTPYVVDRFNAVADRGDVDFEAWFDNYRESDRSWDVDPHEWRFRARILGTTDADPPLSRVPLRLIEATRPDVLIANYDRLHMVIGLLMAEGRARRTALRCLPTWRAWEEPSARRDAAKHLLFRAVDAAKVPGPDGAAYARRFGMTAERIWRVQQSIDVTHYGHAADRSGGERERLRDRFGAKGCVFLYVGRIWAGKGLDSLFAAYRAVRGSGVETTMLIVGDGPDEQRYKALTADLPDVKWVGFLQPTQITDVYAASDAFVFPTLGDPHGLVIDEAMAAGLPVISSDAAGDVRLRIKNGQTGFVFSAGDSEALAVAMRSVAADPLARSRLGSAARASVQDHTSRNYARDFTAFVDGALAERPRRSAAAVLARLSAIPARALLRVRQDRQQRQLLPETHAT